MHLPPRTSPDAAAAADSLLASLAPERRASCRLAVPSAFLGHWAALAQAAGLRQQEGRRDRRRPQEARKAAATGV